MSLGYIYVLSNPRMPGLLKIGFTCGSVERRRRELSGATGVPDEFVIDYFRLTEDAEDVERLVHGELDAYRASDRREFFAAELAAVIATVERLTKLPPIQFTRPTAPSTGSPESRSCRRCGNSYIKTDSKSLCPSCGF